MIRILILSAILLSAACLPGRLHAGEGEADVPAQPPVTVDDIPVAIASASVGDWAEYVTDEGHILRLTVVEQWTEGGEDYVVIQSATKRRRGRGRERTSEDRVSVQDQTDDLRALGPEDTLHRSSVLHKGVTLDCIVVNYREGGRLQRQSYLSGQVPVYGLVRGVMVEGNTQTVSLRLTGFGFSGSSDGE